MARPSVLVKSIIDNMHTHRICPDGELDITTLVE